MTSQDEEFDLDDARFRIKPYQQIVSSCSGAFITSLTMTPLDVIKTRLQTQQKTLLSNKCFLYCNGLMDHLCPCGPTSTQNGHSPVSVQLKSSQHYQGTIDAMFKISRHEGVSSLWSGLGPTLVLAIPATVIYFVCYEQLRLKIKDFYLERHPEVNRNEQPYFIPLAAGMSARVISVSVVSPLELVRTKMQSQRISYFEVGNALKGMMAQEGIRGLWRGLGPSLCRDVPFSGIYWTSYETIKKWYGVTGAPGFSFSFCAGAVAGSIAALFTTPFDVVKTHKQIEFGEKVLFSDNPKAIAAPESKTIDLFRNILKINGFRGLFAGVTPRIIKIAPACAIMIASFEYGKSFFHAHNVNIYRQKLTQSNVQQQQYSTKIPSLNVSAHSNESHANWLDTNKENES